MSLLLTGGAWRGMTGGGAPAPLMRGTRVLGGRAEAKLVESATNARKAEKEGGNSLVSGDMLKGIS